MYVCGRETLIYRASELHELRELVSEARCAGRIIKNASRWQTSFRLAMECRPQSGSKATAFGAKSNDQQSDDVRFEPLAGWFADTAAAPQIPDVFSAVPKGVSLVTNPVLSIRS